MSSTWLPHVVIYYQENHEKKYSYNNNLLIANLRETFTRMKLAKWTFYGETWRIRILSSDVDICDAWLLVHIVDEGIVG